MPTTTASHIQRFNVTRIEHKANANKFFPQIGKLRFFPLLSRELSCSLEGEATKLNVQCEQQYISTEPVKPSLTHIKQQKNMYIGNSSQARGVCGGVGYMNVPR